MTVIMKSYARERTSEIMSQVKNGMNQAVLLVENQAKKNVDQTPPKHPLVQTGRLKSSITSEVTEGGNKIEGRVGTNVYYGKYLELGHADGSMHYPWLFPALELSKSKIKQLLKGGRNVI